MIRGEYMDLSWIWQTVLIYMIITEYLSLKGDILETLFSGKAVIVIENGIPNTKNQKN